MIDPIRLGEWIKMEKETVRHAPVAFIVAVLLGGLAGFGATECFHQERVSILKDQNEDLRQRLNIVPAENKYSKFTNAELRQAAEPLLAEFRSFINESRVAFGRLFNNEDHLMGRLRGGPEDIEFNNKFVLLNSKYQDQYDKKFKINLILLRNAIQDRLSEEQKSKVTEERYQRTNMNTFVLTEIADDFERLVKNLP